MTDPQGSVARFGFDRYLNTRSAQAPTFSPDGQAVAFLADITGIQQLWQVPIQGGWPDQLTFTSELIRTARYGHHTPVVVFGMDSGGNEREQLFLLREGQVTEIVRDEAVMHYLGAISPDDARVAYCDNRRQGAFFDIYVCDLDGSHEQCVYEQDGSNFVTDWSPDGATLLVSRRTGALDGELFLLELASGTATHLTPHDDLAIYHFSTFAHDGQTIYLVTNQGSEFARAARMDLTRRSIEFLTEDDADIDWLALAPDGRYLALVRNEEGYGRLTMRSTETGEVRRPLGLPDGVPMQPVWSSDSRRLAFTFTSPTANLNIWVWGPHEDQCRQITWVGTGGIPAESFIAPELFRYPSFDGRTIPTFLYMPEGVERPPVVINVHGGPEGQAMPTFSAVFQYFLERGYAVLAPNVRGSTGYGREYTHLDDVEKRMDSVADLQAGAEWLRTLPGVDGGRVAIMGGSYGGFMVLAALTAYPDTWTAGVDIVGIANFDTFLRNTGAYRRHWRIPEYGDPDRDASLFQRISPIHHVHRIRAPLMVIHGDNDPRVPLSEAEQIVEALRRRGSPVEFLRFPDEGHGIVKIENRLVAYPAIGAFLDTYLR